MGSRAGDRWTILAALVGGGLLVLAAAVVALREVGLPPGAYALLIPLVVYAVPLVLALAAHLEFGPARPPAGDLDRLLTLKRAGSLPPARRPAPRTGGRLPEVARRSRPAPTGALDRLVQRKREWTGPADDAEPGAG
jgi:hypothetical protein